jgi:hypothetical protein
MYIGIWIFGLVGGDWHLCLKMRTYFVLVLWSIMPFSIALPIPSIPILSSAIATSSYSRFQWSSSSSSLSSSKSRSVTGGATGSMMTGVSTNASLEIASCLAGTTAPESKPGADAGRDGRVAAVIVETCVQRTA